MSREIGLISDGCTLAGYVAAAPGLHCALRFQYRPATISERICLAVSDGPEAAREFARHTAALLAEKLVSWQLVDAGMAAPPISAAAVLALQPQLFEKLHHIVLGYVASDIDPAWPLATADEVLRDEVAAQASGRTPGEVGCERREKNCSRG
ncbi:MAG TPA: hypothetical protein VHY20_01880 [Pirellulales bacterium]|jgi:hypothetical protein|nr:hypothetical protein [Pirellulales bacterium]